MPVFGEFAGESELFGSSTGSKRAAGVDGRSCDGGALIDNEFGSKRGAGPVCGGRELTDVSFGSKRCCG